MELIRHDTNINFVSKRLIAIACSAILILIGIVSLVAKGGPAYGIDFAGGTLLQVQIAAPTDAARVRELLKDLPMRGISIQQFGEGANEYLIKMPESSSELKGVSADIQAALEKGYGAGKVEIRRTEMVGPQVGKDLRQKGLLAIIFAICGMLIYITWRFEFRFGVGAVIALAHDVFITIAIFSVFNLEIDLTIVAALLTIIGYSVNDTVIVCDRIRENMGRHSKENLSWIINRSINETLSRTFMTSGLTLLSVTALYFFGGSVIQNFALAMLLGITVGTYSSVFVASPVILFWDDYKARRPAAAK